MKRAQRNYDQLIANGWHVIVIWECQLKPVLIDHTMREVELQLNKNMLARYRKIQPFSYLSEEEIVLPMAAEESSDYQ